MSSSTIQVPTTPSLTSRSSIAWGHLLWKDFYQVWQLLVGIVVIEIGLQFLTGILESFFSSDLQDFSTSAVNIALASPTLLAIACCGILIGQERQTGSWTWNSSLPIRWQQSLASKVLVWLGASIASVAILLVVASMVLWMNDRSLSSAFFSATSPETSWTQWMTLIIALQVFLYLAIATLLFKDTLMAIVITAFGVFALHGLVPLLFSVQFSNYLNRLDFASSREAWILIAHFVSFFVGTLGLAWTYRWRYGVGQYALLSLFARSAPTDVSANRSAWQAYARTAGQPSESRMLIQHGLRTSFWLRTSVFGCSMLLLFVSIDSLALQASVAFLASCVLGVSVFSGEQTSNRYRFFADRGVHWRKLVISQLAYPALLLTLLVSYAATSATTAPEVASLYGYCFAVFAVGMFSSLVFPNPIVSIIAALAVSSVALYLNAFIVWMWYRIAPEYWLSISIWFPVSIGVVLVMTIRQVPRWLTQYRLKATGVYFNTVLVAGLIPTLFGITFGFLHIPNVPWQGTQLEQIDDINWSDGPDLLGFQEALELDFPISTGGDLLIRENIPGAIALPQLSPTRRAQLASRIDDPDWVAREEKLLIAIEQGGSKPERFDFQATTNLSNMLEASAVFALLATQERQQERAIRLWKANRRLTSFSQQPALQPAAMRSLAMVWNIWSILDDDDLQFLADSHEMAELMPVPSPTPDQFREVLRARATLKRFGYRIGATELFMSYRSFNSADWHGAQPMQAYPPIRWAHERQQALALSDDLQAASSATYERSYKNFYDPLLDQYFILKRMEASFASRVHQFEQKTR